MLVLSGFAETVVDVRVGLRAEVFVVMGIRLVFADAGESNTGPRFCPAGKWGGREGWHGRFTQKRRSWIDGPEGGGGGPFQAVVW